MSAIVDIAHGTALARAVDIIIFQTSTLALGRLGLQLFALPSSFLGNGAAARRRRLASDQLAGGIERNAAGMHHHGDNVATDTPSPAVENPLGWIYREAVGSTALALFLRSAATHRTRPNMLAGFIAQLGIDDSAQRALENVGIERAPAPGFERIVASGHQCSTTPSGAGQRAMNFSISSFETNPMNVQPSTVALPRYQRPCLSWIGEACSPMFS